MKNFEVKSQLMSFIKKELKTNKRKLIKVIVGKDVQDEFIKEDRKESFLDLDNLQSGPNSRDSSDCSADMEIDLTPTQIEKVKITLKSID